MPSAESTIGTFLPACPDTVMGSLDCVPVVSVIGKLARERRSGDLQISCGRIIRFVYFDGGSMVFASSNLVADRLGQRLVNQGRITRRDVDRAQVCAEKGRQRIGMALVQAGLLTAEEVSREVVLQVEQIILSIFGLTDGVYVFDERDCAIPEDLRVPRPTERILLRGSRAMANARLVQGALPPLDTLVRARRPERLELDEVERAVVEAAGDGASIRSILSNVRKRSNEVPRACVGLLAAGHLEPYGLEEKQKETSGASVGRALTPSAIGVGPRRKNEMTPCDLTEVADEPTPTGRVTASWPSFDSEQILRDASLHLQMRDWTGAVPLLCRLIEHEPNIAGHHVMLATAMSRISSMKRTAERHFQEALRLEPRNARFRQAFGHYYRESGMAGRAAAEFREALRINPKLDSARRDLDEMNRRDSKETMKEMFRKFLSRA